MPLFQSQPREDLAEPSPPREIALLELRIRFHLTIMRAMEDHNGPLVLRLWKLGSALQKKMTRGATSGYVLSVGMGFTDPAMVARSLARLDWNVAELKELAGALTGESVPADDAREAASHDFRRFYDYMIHTGPAIPGLAGVEEPGFPEMIFYQKHRTANHYAEQMRVWRDSVDISTIEEMREKMNKCATSFPRWLNPNFYGTSLLIKGWIPPVSGSFYHNGRAGRRMIQVLIALHRCLKARGSLPASLDELVPEFLPSVPEDPYNGGPLSWNREHRAVQNTGGEGVIPPVDPKQTKLVSDDYRTFLFRTKADEDARRAGEGAAPAPAVRRN